MKSYLTEADATATIIPHISTRPIFRQPLKLLQNLQQCQNSIRSKMAASSAALKSITNRPRRIDPSFKASKILDTGGPSARNKTTALSSRPKNTLNAKTTFKPDVSEPKKQDSSENPNSTLNDIACANANSVGSLTSSPKWSHIKNKFENGPTIDKPKLNRTTSLTNEECTSSKLVTPPSKSLNSLLPETKLTMSKTKNLVTKKNERHCNSSQLKYENKVVVPKVKVRDEKKTDVAELKRGSGKDKTFKPSSPKSSHLNFTKGVSNLKSNNASKKSQGNISYIKPTLSSLSNSSKGSHLHKSLAISSVSLSSSSSKNSEADDAQSISSTNSCNSSNNSQLSIPSACAIDSKKSDSPKEYLSKSSISSILTENVSALHNGLSTNRTALSSKTIDHTSKKNAEDTTKLCSKQTNLSQNVCDQNRPVRKSFLSDKDRLLLHNISNINKSCKMSSLAVKQSDNKHSKTDGAVAKASIAENVGKISGLVKRSPPSAKTIWIKDEVGNWIKKTETESKTCAQSKVASIRSKFLECSKETAMPLTKSTTANNVPSKNTIRPLAKSSTTSSICDKSLFEDITRNIEDNHKRGSNSDCVKSRLSEGCTVKSNKPLKRNSVDSDAKLNIVQRAILSYEGNLALLSPESQRRLKLVNEKVHAQTDDDKILRSKVQNENPARNSAKDIFFKKAQSPSPKQSVDQRIGEPVLPTREFLNRYQITNKDHKKLSTAHDHKASQKNNVEQTFSVSAKENSSDDTQHLKVETANNFTNSKVSISGESCEKGNQNLILNLSGNKANVRSTNSQDGKCVLQPNSSFLWRCSTVTSSELSKSSTTSSVSLTSSDYRNYYDVQNYYSSLDLEIDKRSEISEDPIYIDSQESNSSENNYASSNGPYENVRPKDKNKILDSYEDWSDASDDEYNKSISNESSTLKKKRNKRAPAYRENHQMKTANAADSKKKLMNDTISFTDSNDTLINDEVRNESTFDMTDSSHFYEPVYESLGNYLRDPIEQEEEYDNCSLSLSPDDGDNGDFHCSLTSLESAESTKPEKDDNPAATNDEEKANKKPSNKISQLKRHLSWTKNDIRLELSSKFNKIKIKKNGPEIGVKVQEHESANTSPKKKTFIKCILRQKSSSSIPVKRSPSPKKESAMFYVHLSMGSEKQRPCSDSVIANDATKVLETEAVNMQKTKKLSEPSLQFNTKCGQQRPRYRKVTAGPTIQRPKTPPPLPPMVLTSKCNNIPSKSQDSKSLEHNTEEIGFIDDVDSHLYTCLDPSFFHLENSNSTCYENEVFKQPSNSITDSDTKLSSKEDFAKQDIPVTSNKRTSDDLSLPLLNDFQTELLKSPFEEEPMYQFYQKDVQQAALWCSADGSESEDDGSSKFSDTEYQPVMKPPVLQSQMSAMDLVHGEAGLRTLWCEVPEVMTSGILKSISSKERKIQEAMFEVITSEASYLKSLNFLIEHFVQCPEFSGSEKHILDKRERHVLFSDIQPVRDVSAGLLVDLEKRWLENIVVSNICDIVYHHASNYFNVYIKYCSNQLYQERLLRELKEKRPEFVAILKRLESNPVCQGLDMHSFLMLPMQRITRLPLLIDAIFHRLSPDQPIHDSCKMALATVNKLVAECNEGARKMERMEEMLVISQQLDFKDCKGLGLLSASRWLVKKGELVQLLLDTSNRRTFGRSSRWCKIQLYLFLFTDLLVVTRKKSDDSYSVVDFCPRNMLQVLSVDDNMPPLPMRLPSSYRNLFQIIMLNNKEGKTVEMLLSCLLESDRTRWMDAMTPVKSENPDEKIYEEWDWPQFQCTHAYNAQQPDELSLEEADVVNVLRKMADGWFEGERIRDGVRGWFPSSHAVEIITSHVRARNLRQRYRLLMLSQTYLEEQYKAQALQTKK